MPNASSVINFIMDIRFIIAQNVVILTFLCILLLPLYKLSRSRMALILLLSKTMGNIIFMTLSTICTFIRLFNSASTLNLSPIQTAISVQPLAIRLFLLALAANRAHCVFFPIHYANNVGKKQIWVISIGIWLFSATFTALREAFILNYNILPSSISPTIITAICFYSSAFLYGCVAIRLIYLKYNAQNIGLSNQEKSHFKICIVCFFGLLPFAVDQLATWITIKFVLEKTLADILYLITIYSSTIALFIEDLCLLIICAEFRRYFSWRSNCVASQNIKKINQNNKNIRQLNVGSS